MVFVGHHIHGEKGSMANIVVEQKTCCKLLVRKKIERRHGKYGSGPPPCCFSEEISLIF